MKDTPLKTIILDTTYVLPLFGIAITLHESFPRELSDLWSKKIRNYSIILPSVCLIETWYKLHREYRKSQDPEILQRYPTILPTVTKNLYIKIYHPFLDTLTAETAMELRTAGHTDMMDCWIASTAWRHQGILITEDEPLKENLRIVEKTKTMQFWNWQEFVETWDK